jgi:hypothetical protein
MLQTIIKSIQTRQVLTFTYSGITRVAEPHAVGLSRAGNDVLRCFQTQGGHINSGHEWDLCEVSKISNLRATGQSFVGERPGYKRGDSHMTNIYAQL